MSVPLLRPKVSDLSFEVYAKPLHPELFEVLAYRRVERDGSEITARITRTGHIISWTDFNSFITEVAAGDQAIPESRRLVRRRMRGEHSDTVMPKHGITYQSSFQVETLPPELFLQVHDEILSDGGKRGLLHRFRPHYRLGLAPLGYVSIEAGKSCLFFTAFHTFPDEYTVIKTQSLIETP